jgi:hypothetical protein
VESLLDRLQFKLDPVRLVMALSEEETWMDDEPDFLFYKSPKTLVSYIEGGHLQLLTIKFHEETDEIQVSIDSQKTISLEALKVFKYIEQHGFGVNNFD